MVTVSVLFLCQTVRILVSAVQKFKRISKLLHTIPSLVKYLIRNNISEISIMVMSFCIRIRDRGTGRSSWGGDGRRKTKDARRRLFFRRRPDEGGLSPSHEPWFRFQQFRLILFKYRIRGGYFWCVDNVNLTYLFLFASCQCIVGWSDTLVLSLK